jgi:hypothetical protein
VKRIKKKINDFILNNYHDLFFSTPTKSNDTTSPVDIGTSEDSPNRDIAPAVPTDFQTKLLTPDDFIKNPKILSRVSEEL